jgi:ubiquinone/menaquinone biosynthesis C-methylase UbiE
MQRFRAQFGKPIGFWGRVAGWIMGHRPSNRDRNAWAVSLLNIQPSDNVLEIGCGPGLAIARMSELISSGQIVGIDHSEVMLEQARKRNAYSINRGRVELLLASVSDLPPLGLLFDKILSVNSIQYWGDSTAVLRILRRLMNPWGQIAIALQPRFQEATNEDTQGAGREMVERLKEAGFSQVRLEIKPMKPISVACAVGINEV